MVCSTVYDNSIHPVFLLIIQMCLCVKVTVCCVQRQTIHHLIGECYIYATRSGIVHVLIHACLNICTTIAQICCCNASGNLTRIHVYQRNHIIQLVQIACN